MRSASHVVIGAGGLGAATAYWLSQLNDADVLVLEQYELGHSYGASEDHSRIIRHCYHSPDYTALTPAMYETWRQLEQQTGLQLLTLPGCVDLAVSETPGADELTTYAHAMDVAGIPYDQLTGNEVRKRWPEWQLPENTIGMFHAEAGILDIHRANSAHTALAMANGVTFLPQTPVYRLSPSSTGVEVHTPDETYIADNVIVCCGAWSAPLLATMSVDLPITLSQEQVTYFASKEPHRFSPERWPISIWHADSLFYTLPVYGEAAVKSARDMAGRFVTQETRRWEPDPEETAIVSDFLDHRLPAAHGPELYSKTCVYDMPPDRNFILDHVPNDPRVLVAVGAGHAAKFASLIGKIMSQLAASGETDYAIDPFRFNRPAITDPTFPSTFRLSGADVPT